MRRFAIASVVTAITLVVLASPAWAHVKISPESAPKGSDAVLTFVAPNESDKANFVKLVVHFPHDHPIADAATQPMAGWTATVATFHTTTPIQTDNGPVNDAVDTVTWTATGGGTPPGDFQQFPVAVGLPDDADTLAFPADQYYSDKTLVQWNQETPPGGPEPDHPRPELTLTAAEGSTTPTTTAAAATTSSVKKSDVDNAKTLGIIGLIVGLAALVVAIVAIVLSRKKATT